MNSRSRSKLLVILAVTLVTLLSAASGILAEGVPAKPVSYSSHLGSDRQFGDAGRLGVARSGPREACHESEDCPADGSVDRRGAVIIVSLPPDGPALARQTLVEQIRPFLGECQNGKTAEEAVFATGPDDLFPPEGIAGCTIPRLLILPLPDTQQPLMGEVLVEQMRTFLDDCAGDAGSDMPFATGPDDLFPPAGIAECPLPRLLVLALPNHAPDAASQALAE